MRLKYVAGEKTAVYWGQDFKRYPFTPIGEAPEKLASFLLNHSSNKGKFILALEDDFGFNCDACQFKGKNEHALKIHNGKFHKKETQ